MEKGSFMLNTNISFKQNTVIIKGVEAIQHLQSMGLTYDVFAKAVLSGYHEQKAKSIYSPPITKSIAFWDNSIVMLRELLSRGFGWRICDKYNLNRTISPDNKFAIVVSSGNANVGKNYNPSTMNRKGELSAAVIDVNNNIQLSLFPMTNKKSKKYNIERIPHWFFLYYNDGKKIWMELSYPREIGNDGRISSWYTRIILEPVEIVSSDKISNVLGNRSSNIDLTDIDISKKY